MSRTNNKFPIMIPMGKPTSIAAMWADSFRPIWKNGMTGQKNSPYVPPPEVKEEMLKNIEIAKDRLLQYLQDLEDAKFLLEHVEEPKPPKKKKASKKRTHYVDPSFW